MSHLVPGRLLTHTRLPVCSILVKVSTNVKAHTRPFHLSICRNVNFCLRTELKRNGLLSAKRKNGIQLGSGVFLRLKSTNAAGSVVFNSASSKNETVLPSDVSSPVIDAIPEPPVAPAPEVLDVVQAVGEPSFASLGLGGYTPIGIVQNCMEFLHINCDLPWWGCIAIGTVAVRILIFPLVIAVQRNAAKMNNHLPQLQVLQMKMSDARQSGNHLEAARYAQELMLFMREKGLSPFKNMLVPLAQAPVFLSFFLGLRRMTNTPVESMKEGGLFWFTDLTVPDPYFLLPIITSVTMWITIEVGTDSIRASATNMQMMKYLLRAMPVIIFPFAVNFPGAILCYWVSTNFISLVQVGFLRIPAVRQYFKIERLVNFEADALPVKPKGFVKGFKESWTNMKISRELEDRHRIDEVRFKRAGKAPIVKTYKYDPTQQTRTEKQPLVAKKRETQ